ncbi:hypothetical protein CEXT_370261 [Caerostris extrusa]|uniref:Uncharacterized protein n=1 Tax=Caerostris extrusa TaxID=172846 RepID=A0AAV4NDK4_CAEEX|nr:hypothetical protein CEXT_370261 [Caerostris extrusa]
MSRIGKARFEIELKTTVSALGLNTHEKAPHHKQHPLKTMPQSISIPRLRMNEFDASEDATNCKPSNNLTTTFFQSRFAFPWKGPFKRFFAPFPVACLKWKGFGSGERMFTDT